MCQLHTLFPQKIAVPRLIAIKTYLVENFSQKKGSSKF